VELKPDRPLRISPKEDGTIRVKAMVIRKLYLPTEDVEVLEDTPYSVHFWKLYNGKHDYEYTQAVEAETYQWDLNDQRLKNPQNPYSSGVNAVVKNDLYDWAVPKNRTYEKKFSLKIVGRADTTFAYNGKSSPANAGAVNGKAELEITVPVME
jgi:hypothetical protein